MISALKNKGKNKSEGKSPNAMREWKAMFDPYCDIDQDTVLEFTLMCSLLKVFCLKN